MSHNFKLSVVDTDSIMFHKPDGSDFTPEEQESLLLELNATLPEKIKMAHDGIFKRVVVVKSKNYILDNGKKIKFKGSSMIAAQKEPILLKFIEEIGGMLLADELSGLLDLYNKYIILSQKCTSICEWATKKTITKSVMNPKRLNEQKVLDALEGKEVQEGDKIYVYPTTAKTLRLVENWQHDEDKHHLLKRVWNTMNIFKNLVDMSLFPKYYNQKNKKILEEMIK